MKTKIIFLFIFVCISVYMVNATNINNCQILNNTNTEYVLTSDIHTYSNDTCILINASNITLDLNNYAIIGNLSHNVTAILIESHNINITNGKINQSYIGLKTNYFFYTNDSSIINLSIMNMSYYGVVLRLHKSNITDLMVDSTGNDAFYSSGIFNNITNVRINNSNKDYNEFIYPFGVTCTYSTIYNILIENVYSTSPSAVLTTYNGHDSNFTNILIRNTNLSFYGTGSNMTFDNLTFINFDNNAHILETDPYCTNVYSNLDSSVLIFSYYCGYYGSGGGNMPEILIDFGGYLKNKLIEWNPVLYPKLDQKFKEIFDLSNFKKLPFNVIEFFILLVSYTLKQPASLINIEEVSDEI